MRPPGNIDHHHDKTKTSAEKIVTMLLRRRSSIIPLVAKQLVDEERRLGQTDAGKFVLNDLIAYHDDKWHEREVTKGLNQKSTRERHQHWVNVSQRKVGQLTQEVDALALECRSANTAMQVDFDKMREDYELVIRARIRLVAEAEEKERLSAEERRGLLEAVDNGMDDMSKTDWLRLQPS